MIKIQNGGDPHLPLSLRFHLFVFGTAIVWTGGTIHRFFCLFSRCHTADAVRPALLPGGPGQIRRYRYWNMHFLLLPVSSVLFSHVCGVPARLSLSNNKVIHIKYLCQLVRIFFLGHSVSARCKERLPLSPAQVPAPGPGASTRRILNPEPFYSSALPIRITLDTDSRSLPLPVPRYKLFSYSPVPASTETGSFPSSFR